METVQATGMLFGVVVALLAMLFVALVAAAAAADRARAGHQTSHGQWSPLRLGSRVRRMLLRMVGRDRGRRNRLYPGWAVACFRLPPPDVYRLSTSKNRLRIR